VPRGHAREVVALEQLHHHERRAVVRPHVEHAHDVIRRELRGRARLAQEALDQLGARRQIAPQDLDGDALSERLVPRLDDEAHAAGADAAHHAEPLREEIPFVEAGVRERRHGVGNQRQG
jgi:hypothetical protein